MHRVAGDTRRSPNPLRRAVGRSTAFLFDLLPRRVRFRTLVRAALLLAPLLAKAGRFPPGRLLIDSPKEHTLFRLLDFLTRYGCEFDPEIDWEHPEVLHDAMRAGRGVLAAAPHAMLTILLARYVHDQGVGATALSGSPMVLLHGVRDPGRTLISKHSLIRVRTALRMGNVVVSMVDQRPKNPSKRTVFELPGGPFVVADALFHLARRVGAQIVFVAFRIEGNRVRATAAAPPGEATIPEVVGAFAEFVLRHAAATARGWGMVSSPPAAGRESAEKSNHGGHL